MSQLIENIKAQFWNWFVSFAMGVLSAGFYYVFNVRDFMKDTDHKIELILLEIKSQNEGVRNNRESIKELRKGQEDLRTRVKVLEDRENR